MPSMRMMVALDPDTERIVRGLMWQSGISFKQALNDAIRAGLASILFRRPIRSARWDKALAVAEAIGDGELSRNLLLNR